MSKVSDFKRNPESFLKKHKVRLEEFALTDKFDIKSAGTTHRFKQTGGIDFEIHSGGEKGTDNLKIVAAAADTGVRALPWRASELTYMRLDAAARWFFTGPIEGCFIYVARGTTDAHRGETYVFHVNANSVIGAGNAAAKDAMVLPIIRAKGLVPINRLTYADYCPAGPNMSGQGFVYGWCATGNWHFRIHSLAVKTTPVTTALGYNTFETDSIKTHLASGSLPSGISMDL